LIIGKPLRFEEERQWRNDGSPTKSSRRWHGPLWTVATPKVRAMPAPARDGAMTQIPLGRFGEAAELAGVAAFLLSPAAAYINGTVLRVDGGFGLSMR
jgi:NAD(P)-dependent dehydrogenase (short-subunit alcohol dehydrogenase family)